jgi:hypothetical protein
MDEIEKVTRDEDDVEAHKKAAVQAEAEEPEDDDESDFELHKRAPKHTP